MKLNTVLLVMVLIVLAYLAVQQTGTNTMLDRLEQSQRIAAHLQNKNAEFVIKCVQAASQPVD